MNVSYFKFDINDDKDEMENSRPMPFRLTPNIAEFVTMFGIWGPLSASIVAAARCFIHPNYKLCSILRTILRDEVVAMQRKRMRESSGSSKVNTEVNSSDATTAAGAAPTATTTTPNVLASISEANNEQMKQCVNRTVATIMNRLTAISYFDTVESKRISLLIQMCISADNLCRMDPAWLPWL